MIFKAENTSVITILPCGNIHKSSKKKSNNNSIKINFKSLSALHYYLSEWRNSIIALDSCCNTKNLDHQKLIQFLHLWYLPCGL